MPESVGEDLKLTDKQMVETLPFYCPGCGRFIGYQAIVWGSIRVKCPRCKQWVMIDIGTNGS